jgi:hypothetical protein
MTKRERAEVKVGPYEATIEAAVKAALRGETAAISRLRADLQPEAQMRFNERTAAGEGRADHVVTPPLAPGMH